MSEKIIIKHYCDRCGKEIEVKGHFNYFLQRGKVSARHANMELCQECYDDIYSKVEKEFLKKKW